MDHEALTVIYYPGTFKTDDFHLLESNVHSGRVKDIRFSDRNFLVTGNSDRGMLAINGGSLRLYKKVFDWILENLCNNACYSYTDLTYLAHPDITFEYYPKGFFQKWPFSMPDDLFLPNSNLNMKYAEEKEVKIFCNTTTAEALSEINSNHFEYPQGVLIETTRRCNLRCIQCNYQTRNLTRFEGASDLPFETAFRLAAEIRQWPRRPSVEFCLRGEGLLHKRITEVIRLFSEINCYTVLFTNAQLINRHVLHELKEAGLSSLYISVDAFSKERYETIRRGASFEKLIDAIDEAMEFYSRGDFKISLSMVRMEENRDEWERLFELYEKRCDTTRLQNEVYFSGEMFVAKNMFHYADKSLCIFPWHSVAITVDGDVFSCGVTNFLNVDERLGNINDMNLLDIWHGTKFNLLRSQMLSGAVAEPFQCVRCSRQPCSAGLIHQELNGDIMTRTLESVKYSVRVAGSSVRAPLSLK